MEYEINEEMARKAHEMRSFRDYIPGKATADYQDHCTAQPGGWDAR